MGDAIMSLIQGIEQHYAKIRHDRTFEHHKATLDVVFSLKESINDSDSELVDIKDFLFLRIKPIDKTHCPFLLYLGVGKQAKKLMFAYNLSAPLFEMEIKEEIDLEEWIEELQALLRAEVREVLTYVRDRLIKSKYEYCFILNGEKTIPYVYRTYNIGHLRYLFSKKENKRNSYRPWPI
jgi:hypothetical protein